MILITIHNHRELASEKAGKLLAAVGGIFTDLEKSVNRQIAQQLRVQLAKNRIISDVDTVDEGIRVLIRGWKGLLFEKAIAQKVQQQLAEKGVEATIVVGKA